LSLRSIALACFLLLASPVLAQTAPDDDAPVAVGPGEAPPPAPDASAPPLAAVVTPRQRAAALRREGTALQKAGKLTLARVKFEAAMDICETQMDAEPACVGTTATALGVLADTEGRNEDAKAYFEHALIATEQTFGSSAPQLAPLQFKLGNVLLKLRDWRGAAQALMTSVDLIGKAPGPKHPFAAEALLGAAQAFALTNRLPAMRAAIERALPVCPGSEKGADRCEGRAHNLMGVYYKRTRRIDDAVAEWELAYAAQGRAKALRDQLSVLVLITGAEREVNRLDRAEAAARRGLTLETPQTNRAFFDAIELELAQTLELAGRHDEALAAARSALARAESGGEPFTADVTHAKTTVAELERKSVTPRP
jgi:tetratricopeptide (TPR) repeat protein